MVPVAASLLRNLHQQHSSKLMTVILPPGVQWVENLLQIKLGYACVISLTDFKLKKKICCG
jgi:hypothetical protein